MDYTLKNGFVMKISGKGKKNADNYLKINASGYHGDADYDVNKDAEIYLNDGKDEFKNLICFLCFDAGGRFKHLKEEFKNLFKDEEEFKSMYQEWREFCSDYSEVHDQRIHLGTECCYIIEGKEYRFSDVTLDIFNEDDDNEDDEDEFYDEYDDEY